MAKQRFFFSVCLTKCIFPLCKMCQSMLIQSNKLVFRVHVCICDRKKFKSLRLNYALPISNLLTYSLFLDPSKENVHCLTYEWGSDCLGLPSRNPLSPWPSQRNIGLTSIPVSLSVVCFTGPPSKDLLGFPRSHSHSSSMIQQSTIPG